MSAALVEAHHRSSPRHPAPPLAAKGFRPFFLCAAAFAMLILPVWLATLAGLLVPTSYLDVVTWHAHEMLFGFALAVIAGFLLTAVGNWTGRETLVGWPLLALCAVWIAGRAGMAAAGQLPRGLPAVLDLAFVPLLAVAIARPLVAKRSYRNLGMVAVLACLWLSDLVIHLDALGLIGDYRRRATTFAVDILVVILVIITGRVVPMFTKNATGVTSVRSVRALDRAAMAAMVLTVVFDVAATGGRVRGAAAAVTAVLLTARAWHWGARYSGRVPLLWILHAGHAWIVVGLGLRAAADFGVGLPGSAATHALTVGAVGALTLGMMSRVALGHTGRPLLSPPRVVASFALVTLAAFVRVVVPIVNPAAYRASLFIAGACWMAAFALFLAVYAPVLASARADAKPG